MYVRLRLRLPAVAGRESTNSRVDSGRKKVVGKKAYSDGRFACIRWRCRASERFRQISSIPGKWLIFCAQERRMNRSGPTAGSHQTIWQSSPLLASRQPSRVRATRTDRRMFQKKGCLRHLRVKRERRTGSRKKVVNEQYVCARRSYRQFARLIDGFRLANRVCDAFCFAHSASSIPIRLEIGSGGTLRTDYRSSLARN
jgi:hypothetical protein